MDRGWLEGAKIVHGGSLSDDFSGEHLGMMWRFFQEYDPGRFSLKEGELVLKAKGTSPADCAPMTIIPVNESYEVSVKVRFDKHAIGGLVLFYNPDAYSALGASNKGIARYKYGNANPWRKLTEGNTVWLKLVNRNNNIAYWYSENGTDWMLYPSGAEVSGFHHNTFGGFLSLRVGLFSAGNGTVSFDDFVYEGLDN